ncbi:hypothetical protein Mgra_00005970 [Meloidogyne graminicola]|uniref:Cytochrome c oxidase assembly protein COX11, mitochondrial n=1 Tax=Meloidogyne graminicola TaxID=189291 RepID=A0A8S9ZMV4_9BILA|nr:hypothetical protein Mgra_00005970 [Meloidogyne graminicola]
MAQTSILFRQACSPSFLFKLYLKGGNNIFSSLQQIKNLSSTSFRPYVILIRQNKCFFKILNFQKNNYFSSSTKQPNLFHRLFLKLKTNESSIYYMTGIVIIMFGLSFAFIPFFRILCETTSISGITQVIAENLNKIANMHKVDDCLIRVQFNADVPSSMRWKFKPLQDEIYVSPGETALAFFTAYNPTNKPIIGISTYNLTPFQAAYYFNKIQCFCFDEQILNPGEEVDLPVFFYIDPDFVNDPLLENVNNFLLSYTFFESSSNLVLPSPFDQNNRPLNNKTKQKDYEDKEKKVNQSILENVKSVILNLF